MCVYIDTNPSYITSKCSLSTMFYYIAFQNSLKYKIKARLKYHKYKNSPFGL